MSSGLPPDVIEGLGPQRLARWCLPLLAVGCGVAGVLVGAVPMMTDHDDLTAVVVEASGTLLAEHHGSVAADRPHNTTWEEDTPPRFSGSIRVDLPDRTLIGFAHLTFAIAADLDDAGVWITRNWAEVHATFGPTSCHGPVAWSFYREPHETGGSMSLRCDDGSRLAATLLKERYEDATAEHDHLVSFTLEDGSYVAGSQGAREVAPTSHAVLGAIAGVTCTDRAAPPHGRPAAPGPASPPDRRRFRC